MIKKRVGIVFGGKSAEHEVSLQSAMNIAEAIDKDKYEVVLIGIDRQGEWQLNDRSSYLLNADDPKHIQLKPSHDPVAVVPGTTDAQFIHAADASVIASLDVVFPIVHGTLGEDGSLQGMLRTLNVPFVGSGVLSSSICMDKSIAKRLLADAGVNVAKGLTVTRRDQSAVDFATAAEALGTPMFIKPANQGSSVGVSKVSTQAAFDEAIDQAFDYDHKIVVEEALVGREIECSVLGNSDPEASLPGEILPQTDFYSYESKYIDEKGADLAIPADLEDSAVKRVQEAAVKAFQTLQCEGLARVDFFLTAEGEVYVNEINTLPGFTKISMYPKLWEISGLPYTDLINRLIDLAIQRHEADAQLKSSVWDS